MKDIIIYFGLLILVLGMSACGPINEMCEHNQDGMGIACHDVFGYDYDEKEQLKKNTNDIKDLQDQIAEISNEINFLQSQGSSLTNFISQNEMQINSLQAQINSLQSDVQNNAQTISTLNTTINNVQTLITNAQTDISNLQSQITQNTIDILNLQIANQNTLSIIEVLDPCGDASNKIDEVLLRMSDGSIIASFSDNGSALTTRLSKVPPSNTQTYNTTDNTACSFKVFATGINANKVCFGSGFTSCI